MKSTGRRVKSLMFACALTTLAATSAAAGPAPEQAEEHASAPVAVQRFSVALPALRDDAVMVLVGTALIGLAAAVRRSA